MNTLCNIRMAKLQRVLNGKVYDPIKNIIYNSECELVRIGTVKMGKIVSFKK